MRRTVVLLALVVMLVASVAGRAPAADLRTSFATPPEGARPWVYWMWLSGNVTREGITADMEAMRRVGIGGAIVLNVENGTPDGPVKFMDAGWQELFKHTVAEAKRLGMELNANNGQGYFGSGGPWVPPEKAMQSVIASETRADGGARWSGTLPRPTTRPEYRDIAVIAVAEPALADPKKRFKVHDLEMKALQWKTWVAYRGTRSAPPDATAPADAIIPREAVIDLTDKFDRATETLTWDVPPAPSTAADRGGWTIFRFGHAWNGSKIGPVPRGEGGPETDKLDATATRLHFDAFVKRLNDIAGPQRDGALVATHVDSWEGGGQTWTPAMREEFRRRRGYDIVPWLPVLSGRVIGDLQTTERFLWDLRKTASELMVENYVKEFHRLSTEHGLRFTFEAYTTAGNDLDAANHVDEPTAEFWTPNGQGLDFQPTIKSMASAAHLNGRAVVGAEAFTSGNQEKWLWHPGMIKWIGDRALAQGANRFVFHRYSAQRFIDARPGLQMGPWGLHYERTNTWWEWSGKWHEYVTRCQHLLRQGEAVADVLALQPEEPLQRFQNLSIKGFDYDACGPDTFLNDVTARDKKLTLKSGRQYRVLSLTHGGRMTVAMLTRIRDLVRDGGIAVVGEPPAATPGLSGYPESEAQLASLVTELWGERAAGATTAATATTSPGATAAAARVERAVGRGKVFGGMTVEEALAKLDVPPDFASEQALHWIHRAVDGTDVYFVANPRDAAVVAECDFRVAGGRQPELWDAETGHIRRAAHFSAGQDPTLKRRALPEGNADAGDRTTRVVLPLGPHESIFVVFPPADGDAAPRVDPVVALTRDDKPVLEPTRGAGVRILKATYGVPGEAARTIDAREKVQAILDRGETIFAVRQLAEGHDPAWGVVKTLSVEYEVDGRTVTFRGTDTESFKLKGSTAPPAAVVTVGADRAMHLHAREAGRYEAKLASGKSLAINVPAVEPAREVTGPWRVSFEKGGGAPAAVEMERLASWHEHADPGVKYFSGVATYTRALTIPSELLSKDGRLHLNLGDVQVMARVKLNGRDLGILWRNPYRVDVTEAARAGENELEIAVVNLWPNRLIGDEQLPEDSDRNRNGTLKSWPQWLLEGKPSPSGRLTFSSWRLWKKADALQPSGLIGPVTLEPSRRVPLAD